jgi:hypothetical protein
VLDLIGNRPRLCQGCRDPATDSGILVAFWFQKRLLEPLNIANLLILNGFPLLARGLP